MLSSLTIETESIIGSGVLANVFTIFDARIEM
jgi:hypothetical protein